jgi:hypothetical protein
MMQTSILTPVQATKVDHALDRLVDQVGDLAHTVWDLLHPAGDADWHDCKFCGKTMYPCMDYTHAPNCPTELLIKAVDDFEAAVNAVKDKPLEFGIISPESWAEFGLTV